MASGHRKRKAAAVYNNVLHPAGYTNVSEVDRGVAANQAALVNTALYGKAGTSPTFTAASATQLSDAVSNADGAWTYAGLSGEVTNVGAFLSSSLSGAVGLSSAAKHYYFPLVGAVQTDCSKSNAPVSPVIIYSNDGPQSAYVPYYLGGTTATASIKFGAAITGAGTPSHLVVYVAGQMTSGDQIRLIKPSDASVFASKVATGSNTSFGPTGSVATASATDLSSALYRKAFLIATGTINTAGGIIVEFSSSAKESHTPVAGVFVVLSSGSYV